jgi:hypothetical protein
MKLLLILSTFFILPFKSHANEALKGNWVECSRQNGNAYTRFMMIDDNKMTEKILVRKEKDGCESGKVLIELNRVFSLKAVGNKITFSLTKDEFVMLDEEEARRLSEKNFCGISDWRVGEVNGCPDEEDIVSETQTFEVVGDVLLLTEQEELKVYKFKKVN